MGRWCYQQQFKAMELVGRALAEAAELGGAAVSVTGHSAGGSLAQITFHEFSLYGETLNACGAVGIDGVPSGGSQVINHVRASGQASKTGARS